MDKSYFGLTDPGRVRDNNEDTFIAEKTKNNDVVIACVIDGVGGYAGGEIASAIARKSIIQFLNRPNADYPALMRDAIIAADEDIRAEKIKNNGHEQMACVLTLAVADLDKNQFWYAHVGDTRLYLLRDRSLVKISKDQSFVGFMEDSGRLTEEEAMRHPKRNEINKALGFGVSIAAQQDYIETGHSPFLPGDVLLVCSDGLSDMVNRQQMTDILNSPASLQQKAEALVKAANLNGGLDNITVVLVKNDKQSAQHEPAMPASKSRKQGPVPAPVAGKAENTETKTVQWEGDRLSATQGAGHKTVRSNTGWITLLSILCVAMAGVIAYLLWQNNRAELRSMQQRKLSVIKPPRNAQEKKLQDTINKLNQNVLILTDSLFKSPIQITEPLQIDRDTLYLIAEKNITLVADSTFKGIPINVRPANKHLRLENFTFQNFSTAIASGSNALEFRKVRFINTPNAVQSVFRFPSGSSVSGAVPASTFTTDSLPEKMN
ncbi:PP2C family protein-serine/threonine phosphatase [Pedobacter deserti]|uniref:PP2C family protein-serine/threonine phosphatase n=1 Tax=Pedobacter deserti TaxID=2817382 RepID=UPI00210D188A|nr:PP2C family serine/threonine-protein phosphatase [Pedobacter sp. SYSU D00382]